MKILIDDTGLIVGKVNDTSYRPPKALIEKIQKTENLNYLWEIAQELNSDKFLSNTQLRQINNDIYKLKKRMNKSKIEVIKGTLIKAINKAINA